MKPYRPLTIQKRWQRAWDQAGIYRAADRSRKPKYYALFEFPYPSGDGLHVGHLRPYTGMDVIARKRRMQGYEVLFPIGWDAFGLPAENYAIKTGIHPAIVTKRNIKNFTRQVKAMGFSFDWSRELSTTDPDYYRWTQWIFIQLFKHGLAYKASSSINWCPSCKIGLANEEVVGGSCERCGTTVTQKEKQQWLLRITKYADKLLAGLRDVDFLPSIKQQQINWIGRKEGIEITYPVVDSGETVTVFTTRPDTNFGATFVVLAPEHPQVAALTTAVQRRAVKAYVAKAARQTPEDRMAAGRRKTGVFTGSYAKNHLTGRSMPIWIGDFVLGSFGTGAVVGVPAHDVRDFEFARAFDLAIVRVVVGPDGDTSPVTRVEQVQEAAGTMINSGFLDGMDIHAATTAMMQHIVDKGWGRRVTSYHLRDWVFSRQRYWGEPIPMIDCPSCGYVPVPESQLPVKLPAVKQYQPRDDGESPLASLESWIKTRCPQCGKPARRETDVMPNWAGSSWYFLRYIDPHNARALASPQKLARWMAVDWYNGGMEHVTLHLLYSRFWNLFLHDIGVVPVAEPYRKRTAHGMILAADGTKMSKSKGNVVNPDDVVARYGVDTLRMYEMFMGPFDQTTPWDPQSIEGVHRFLTRVWNRANDVVPRHADDAVLRATHRLVKKVSDDIESMAFNTAVSAMMVWMNETATAPHLSRAVWKLFLSVLAPFAPHLADELWERLGERRSIHVSRWPEADPALLVATTFTLIVQVNGKVRDRIELPATTTEAAATKAALSLPGVIRHLGAERPQRIIYIPGKLINIVTT